MAPVAVNGTGQGMLCEQNVPFVPSQAPSLRGACSVAPVSWTGWRGGSAITPLYGPQQKYSTEPGALKCNELRKDMDFFFHASESIYISLYIAIYRHRYILKGPKGPANLLNYASYN